MNALGDSGGCFSRMVGMVEHWRRTMMELKLLDEEGAFPVGLLQRLEGFGVVLAGGILGDLVLVVIMLILKIRTSDKNGLLIYEPLCSFAMSFYAYLLPVGHHLTFATPFSGRISSSLSCGICTVCMATFVVDLYYYPPVVLLIRFVMLPLSLCHVYSRLRLEQWGTVQSFGLLNFPNRYPPPAGWVETNMTSDFATYHLLGVVGDNHFHCVGLVVLFFVFYMCSYAPCWLFVL